MMNKKMFKLFKERHKLDSTFKSNSDDQLISVCERKFKLQYEDMKNLRKNLADFVQEIKNLTTIIDNLYTCFRSLYEPDWLGNSEFHQSCQHSIKEWRIFIDEFKNDILPEFENYSEKFPEIKRSIDKCNKKANELQKQKSTYESYRNSKKPDSIKIKKAEGDLKTVQNQFTEINSDLKTDLPQFCDSRIQVYLQIWSLMFRAENKLYQSLQEERKNQLIILNQLNEAASSGKYSILNQTNSTSNHSNFIYDKKKAASVMTLFSSERRPIDSNLSKGGSAWDINTSEQVYDQIPYTANDGSLSRTKSYHVGERTSYENVEILNIGNKRSSMNSELSSEKSKLSDSIYPQFNSATIEIKPTEITNGINKSNNSKDNNVKNNKISNEKFLENLDENDSGLLDLKGLLTNSGKISIETLNQTFTNDSASSTYSIEKKEPIIKKLSFNTKSNSLEHEPVVIMRPPPPINDEIGSDLVLENSQQIYRKIMKEDPRSLHINSSPQIRQAYLQKPLNKRVSMSLNSDEFYETNYLDQFRQQVVVRYNYTKQDDDELDLHKDDIILVLPWQNEDQKEDGWLFGENIETKEKGLFPENHTAKL